MVTNRILLFGGEEQAGNALKGLTLPPDWFLRVVAPDECVFTRPGAIGKVVQDFGPDLVINASGLTDIEECERDREKAEDANFHAVVQIAAQCDTISAPLIHLSSDYVFDGRNGDIPYCPDDAMNPINVYGQTKMMGEEAVRHGLYWHVILRASQVFSAFGENILTRTLRQIDTLKEIPAAVDQKACPTSATTVAEALFTIANAIMNGKGNGFGTFHVCGEPAVTRFEFLQAIMEAYAPFTDCRPKLVPVSAADLSSRAPRPANSALNSDKAREVYGIQPSSWREDLTKAVKQFVEERLTTH